jgi:putative transposase
MSGIPEEIFDYDFSLLAKRSKHPRERIRLLAFAHLKDGKSVQEASRAVKVSRNALYVWLRAFRNKKLDGLKEKGGRGAKLKLPKSEHEAFREAVFKLQENRTGGRLKGQEILELMEKDFGVTCTRRSIYNHLKRANIVWVSARSKHPKSDLETQVEYKKNFGNSKQGHS